MNSTFFQSANSGLPASALIEVGDDLDNGIIDFPRPKTGIPRRCPLWPETVEALREALALRPEPKRPENAGLVFVTQRGQVKVLDFGLARVSEGRQALGPGETQIGMIMGTPRYMSP